MAHRSRLAAVLVDVPAADRPKAVEFWSAAFGTAGRPGVEHPEYHWFGEVTPGIIAMVQGTGDDKPRVHFDVETDDIEAEVARLKGVGATEVQREGGWVVLRDPVGTTFCVVGIQVKEMFEQHAHTWE
jgi:predicted enzyme related to lactoylglutathione lyase